MKKEILIVDDMKMNRDALVGILEKDYIPITASAVREAVEMLENHKDIGMILLDLVMPEEDGGYKVLEYLKFRKLQDKIPVIIIGSETRQAAEERCFSYGVMEFISIPFKAPIVLKRVENMFKFFDYQHRVESQVEEQTKLLKKQYYVLQKQAEKMRETNTRIIDILGTVVESRNLESGEHVRRVKGFTKILGSVLMRDYPEFGLTPEMVETIAQASALHDIGKIAIPDAVLMKPGKLTYEEFEMMKSHTTRGSDILRSIEDIWEDEYREISYEICRHHHERYDGKGYPDGLKEDEIPLPAQIVAIADTYDALVTERVYKAAYTTEQAFYMIINGECGVFSPKIIESFRHVQKEFETFANATAKVIE